MMDCAWRQHETWPPYSGWPRKAYCGAFGCEWHIPPCRRAGSACGMSGILTSSKRSPLQCTITFTGSWRSYVTGLNQIQAEAACVTLPDGGGLQWHREADVSALCAFKQAYAVMPETSDAPYQEAHAREETAKPLCLERQKALTQQMLRTLPMLEVQVFQVSRDSFHN